MIPEKLAKDPNVSLQAKGLYAILRALEGPGGTYVSVPELSRYSGKSDRSVTFYLKELRESGNIIVHHRGRNGTGSNGYSFPVVYIRATPTDT